MKKNLIAILSLCLLFATNVQAQEKKEKAPSIEVRVEKMATQLSLNDEEKAKVKTLMEKQAAEKKEVSKEFEKGSDELKAKMKEVNAKQNEELKALIGEDKFKKWQAILAEERKANKKPE